MDFIQGDEKIMDLTKGYLDHADGQWFIGHYNRCDKPSFYDLVESDFSLAQNVYESNIYYIHKGRKNIPLGLG